MAALTIMNEEILRDTPFVGEDGSAAFYRLLLETRGASFDDVCELDPKRIHVSPALYDAWLEHAGTKAERKRLAALLLDKGPSTDASLDFNMVLTEDGAFLVPDENARHA